MPFEVKPLPYPKNALEPHISQDTVETHFEKHHKGYATKLTQITEGKPEATMSLEDIIRTATGPIFNNAAQVWNHTFYWECMMPTAAADSAGGPRGALAAALTKSFGSVESFKKAFIDHAAAHFGSGWIWLVQRPADGGLEIWEGHDAANPLRAGLRPLLTVDVWEHAYYIDRRNRRAEYLDHWWPLVNWTFVATHLK